MKYTNLFLALALVSIATGCQNDKTVSPEPANPGENVKFSASLSDLSRTIYDGETSSGLKISWTKGDKIAVASPQGSRTNGFYEVNIGETDKQNFANSLDMIGENGVQWGNAASGYNFYAVYPAASANSITVSGSNVSAKGSVDVDQVNFLPNDYTPATEPGKATFELNPDNATMEGQFMYAQTPDQRSGETVNLKFVPASTTLYMTFEGYTHTGNLPADQTNQLMIRSVTLTAPEGTNIAGNFNVQFNADAETAPVFTASGDGASSNSVTVHTIYQTDDGHDGRFLTITEEQNFLIKMIINPMLAENLTIDSNWTISVSTAAGTFTKNLSTSEGANTTLKAGMVHKMTFSKFTIEGDELWQFTPNSWMAQIPDNVYVTELSLPGAWYAWDGEKNESEGYQTSTVSQLFDAGIRAFHVETRVGLTGSYSGGSTILGSINDSQNTQNINNSTVVISGTGSNQGSSSTERNTYYNATSLDNLITGVANKVNQTKEYAVLVVNYSDGGSAGVSSQWRGLWLSKMNALISSLQVTNIYKDPITPNTTIDLVRGKVIILMCIDDANEQSSTIPTSLLSYTDMTWESSNINSSLISPMQWNSWPGSSNIGSINDIAENNLYLNYTIANRTYATRTRDGWSSNYTYSFDYNGSDPLAIPTFSERKSAIASIMSNSDQVYAKGTHNVWYLIGAGGTLAPNKTDDSLNGGPSIVAGGSKASVKNVTIPTITGLNEYLLNEIKSKITNNKPSPLGLVFINQATNNTFNGPELIREIFEMNNQFYLNRAETPETPQNSPANYSTVNANGGNAWNITK